MHHQTQEDIDIKPDVIILLDAIQKDLQITQKIQPIVTTNKKDIDPTELSIVEEYLKYEPENPTIKAFCNILSIAPNPNPVTAAVHALVSLPSRAQTSIVDFIRKISVPRSQADDTSSVELREMSQLLTVPQKPTSRQDGVIYN